jgi:hypothetical protein
MLRNGKDILLEAGQVCCLAHTQLAVQMVNHSVQMSTSAIMLCLKLTRITTCGRQVGALLSQDVVIEAVGDKYMNFEGYADETGTCIGLSYSKLCQSVKPGNIILFADGCVGRRAC